MASSSLEEDARAHASWVHGHLELFADGYDPSASGPGSNSPAGTNARGRDGIINLNRVDKLLTRAFNTHGARAVCLLINSPGGSPAQSSLIYQRLRALRKQHKRVPLYAFVEDAAVSGGYYIACAADEIVARPFVPRRFHWRHLPRVWLCQGDQEAGRREARRDRGR